MYTYVLYSDIVRYTAVILQLSTDEDVIYTVWNWVFRFWRSQNNMIVAHSVSGQPKQNVFVHLFNAQTE